MAVKKFFQKAELKCGRIALFSSFKKRRVKSYNSLLGYLEKIYIRENLDPALSHTVLKSILDNFESSLPLVKNRIKN